MKALVETLRRRRKALLRGRVANHPSLNARAGREHRSQPGEFQPGRAKLISFLIFSFFTVIFCRAVMLHLFPSSKESLLKVADNQYQKSIELSPYRGTIFDRRGEALAISIRRPSLAVNPRLFDPSPAEIQHLSRILGMPAAGIKKVADKKSYFSWLKRKLDFRTFDEAMGLGLLGLFEIREPARFYPDSTAAAQLLGFVGLDNSGLAGLEKLFDRDLRGQPMKVTPSKDAKGNIIFNETSGTAPEKTGNSIHLTIDKVIQEIAEDELEAGVKKARAKQGFAIVSDPHTGHVLAIANYPHFDLNSTEKVKPAQTLNHALNDTFEPGSVTKPFVISKALEARKTTLTERHDCENGMIKIGKFKIHDSHAASFLTTEETIMHSSNICTYKIALKMGKQATYEALHSFGIGTKEIGLGFPGESYGRLDNWTNWAQVRFANVAFGHGFVTTTMELTQAMAALANGGNLIKPTLVDRIVSSDGLVVTNTPTEILRRAIDPEIAREMRQVLKKVVDEKGGTGSLATTEFWTTAGKTGTAQKVDVGSKGYAKDKYLLSFLGFAPVDDPHLVVYVVVDEPHEKPFYGGTWAAPIFSSIVSRTLKYLNVAPDMPPKEKKVKPTPGPIALDVSGHEGKVLGPFKNL